MKRFFSTMTILLSVALSALTGCSSSPSTNQQASPSSNTDAPQSTQNQNSSPKVIVVGLQAEPTSLDAHQISDYNSSRATMELYDQLVQFKDESTELEPDLAEKWDVSPDGKLYTFYLRKDVKFHDGTPFNAEAVKISIDRQIDKNSTYYGTGQYPYAEFTFGSVDHVEVVDDYTVKILLKEPFAPFLSNMAMHAASIVSPTALKKYGKDFTKQPVGTGPFKFASWTPGVEVVLEKNSDYFKGAPKLNKVIFKPITEDQTRLSNMEAGDLDLIVNIPPDDMERLKADENLQMIEQPGMHVWWTAFNTQKKPFNDVRVRQAVNLAINKDVIVNQLLKGTGEIANTPIPPVVWGHNPQVKNYEYDPEKAKKLLAEAGYPNGFEANYGVPESGSGMQQPSTMAAAIQADLAKIGVKLNIQTFEWGTYLDKVFTSPAKSEFDMHQMSWIGDNGDPDNFLYILFSSEQWPTAGFNDAFYKNPNVDQLLRQARVTEDKQKRNQMYAEAQKLIMADAPWVVVDHEKQIVVAKKSVKNFKLHPTGVFRFANVDIE